jgi:hypothetical protein
MPSIRTSIVAALAAGSGLVAGQLNSKCNPVKGDKCPPNAAFAGDWSFDFTTATWADLEKGWVIDDGIKFNRDRLVLDKTLGGSFAIRGLEDAPTLSTQKYIFFGKVEVTVQAAPGQGIITSIVLASDSEDEIDWEFVGSHGSQVETNFFSKGTPKFNTYNQTIPVANTVGAFHTYTVEWTPESMVFSIDGAEVRRASAATADGGKDWPQTPVRVKLGTWIAGNPKTQSQGTIDWSGGPVNMAAAPFLAYVKSVHVVDNSNGVAGAKEYVYKDNTGTRQSIEVVTGAGSSGSSSSSSASPSASASGGSSGSNGSGGSGGSGGNSPTNSAGTGPSGTQSGTNAVRTTAAPGAAPRMEAASTLAAILFLGCVLLW